MHRAWELLSLWRGRQETPFGQAFPHYTVLLLKKQGLNVLIFSAGHGIMAQKEAQAMPIGENKHTIVRFDQSMLHLLPRAEEPFEIIGRLVPKYDGREWH